MEHEYLSKRTERELGEVWKNGVWWMVQGPKGRTHWKYKKDAVAIGENIKKEVIKSLLPTVIPTKGDFIVRSVLDPLTGKPW